MKLFSFICRIRGYHTSLFIQSSTYKGVGLILLNTETIGKAYPCSVCNCSLQKLGTVVQIVNYVKWESK